jgi:hypothetical protein
MSGNNAILQSGNVTPGHVTMWTTDGVVQDAGPATSGALTEVGITKEGGIALAINNTATSSMNGYVEWGVGVSNTGTITLYAESYGGAPVATLDFNINGVTYPFNPAGGGNITGPTIAVSGDLLSFNGTGGNLVQDSGIAAASVVTGGTASAVNDIAVFSTTTGRAIQDSALALAAVIPTIATIAALQAATTTTLIQPQCFVRSYAGTAGVGGGLYVVGANASANGGTIINDASGRSWYLDIGGAPSTPYQFGATGDGTTDDSAAIAAWATWGRGTVPSGSTFAFRTGVTIAAGATFAGSGTLRGLTANMTMVSWIGASFDAVGPTFSGITFDGAAAGITAISMVFGSAVTIGNCTFTGIASVHLDRCYFPKLTNNVMRGNASFAGGQLVIDSTVTSGALAGWGYINGWFRDCSATFGTGGTQVSPLLLLDSVEAMSVSDFQGAGLDAIASNTIVGIQLENISQSCNIHTPQIVGASVGILVNAGSTGSPAYTTITDPYVDSFGTAGIRINGGTSQVDLTTITGGFLTAPEGASVPCFDLIDTGLTTIIEGVSFYQWMNPPTKAGIGIQESGAGFVQISDCFFSMLVTCVNFVGSSNFKNEITGCVAFDNTNIIQGTVPSGSKIANEANSFDAPVIPAYPALPASGVAYENDTGATLNIFISGGTVSLIAINGAVTGLTSGAFTLEPGDFNFITISYSVAPTWSVVAVR